MRLQYGINEKLVLFLRIALSQVVAGMVLCLLGTDVISGPIVPN